MKINISLVLLNCKYSTAIAFLVFTVALIIMKAALVNLHVNKTLIQYETVMK